VRPPKFEELRFKVGDIGVKILVASKEGDSPISHTIRVRLAPLKEI
jgi:hypothetical protein